MAQTQGTKRKVCYYYDGEHSPRAGGGAGPGAGVRGNRQSLVPGLVPFPKHGSTLLALVALVVLDSDSAVSFQEHPE